MNSLAGRYPHEARMLARTIPADSPAAIVGCLLRGASASRSAPIFDSDRSRDDGSDITFLRAALDHNDVHVRRAAVDALASIGGPKAADAVARALADEARDVVLAAIRALGRIGISEPLLSLLEGTGDPAVTAAALRALGEANPNRAFDAAWGLLQNRDPLLASSAVETIGQLRGARRDDGLFIALEHPDPDVVKSALVELSRDMSPRTIARVGTCLDCASYEIRRFAAELLGSSDDPAAELLIRARLDRESDPVVREALNLALVPRGARGAGV
jgi:HEAT repeat protein